MTLYFYAKNVYGQRMIYPACDTSRAYLKALGLKTFTRAALDGLTALGIKLEQTFEKVTL